jgi:uncharacterized membrane protein
MSSQHKIGRWLFALPLAVFGILHLMAGSQMANVVPAWIPGGVVWVYITGAAMLAGAVAMITGKKAKLAS